MRGNTANRRRPTESFNRSPPPPLDHRQFAKSRDSDASFTSGRPSSIGVGRPSTAADFYSDRSHQSSALRSVNAFLSSHSAPLSLRANPVPSLKEISETLKFLLSSLDYPCDAASKWDDHLFFLLKSLNCPFKVSKSTLRAPNTPHNWPSVLALLHWLVQVALSFEHLSSNSRAFVESNSMTAYALDSYMHYIRGEDDLEEELDREFLGKLERERDGAKENGGVLEMNVTELEAKAEALRTGPSDREVLEKERSVLEEDEKKFHAMIAEFTGRIAAVEKVLEEKEKEIRAKEEEKKKISEENEVLKKKVELQTFNARDAERMKRELQAVERDVEESEIARDAWEQKSWELDSKIKNQLNELETLCMECNQALRRLKVDNGFQYHLNEKGSTPMEVMGIDYKSTLKPALESFADGLKKDSMEKLEELIALQHQSSEMTTRIEAKKNHIATLQSHINEMEDKLNSWKKEIQVDTYRCAVEVKKMMEDVHNEAYNLDIMEKEASEVLKAAELKLQEVIKQNEEEIQMRACELFALVDSVSKYKEYMASRISEMKSELAEAAVTVTDVFKGSLSVQAGVGKETSEKLVTCVEAEGDCTMCAED